MFNLNKNNISKYYKNIVKETKQDKQFLYGINPKYKNQENISDFFSLQPF